MIVTRRVGVIAAGGVAVFAAATLFGQWLAGYSYTLSAGFRLGFIVLIAWGVGVLLQLANVLRSDLQKNNDRYESRQIREESARAKAILVASERLEALEALAARVAANTEQSSEESRKRHEALPARLAEVIERNGRAAAPVTAQTAEDLKERQNKLQSVAEHTDKLVTETHAIVTDRHEDERP